MTMPNPMGTYSGAGQAGTRRLTITSANSHTGAITADFIDGKTTLAVTGTYKFTNNEKGGQAYFNLSGGPYKFSLVSNSVNESTQFDILSGNYWINEQSWPMELKKLY